MLDDDGGRLEEDEWLGEEEVFPVAIIKEELGGNVDVDVVAVADETGSDVVVVAVSQEETSIDVRVNVDAVEETGRGMRESRS